MLYDYDARKKRVEYYESISSDSGSPKCYLFEDYLHSYQYAIEHIRSDLKRKILEEIKMVHYDYEVDIRAQRKFERKIKHKGILTNIRFKLGV